MYLFGGCQTPVRFKVCIYLKVYFNKMLCLATHLYIHSIMTRYVYVFLLLIAQSHLIVSINRYST